MKLSFTTLACPAWSWETIVRHAAAYGYQGIEIRGVLGELRLARCEAFQENRLAASLALLAQHRLAINVLDTSCQFHDGNRLQESLEEGLETIDLAASMGVPYIRVFGDQIPNADEEEAIMARAASGLQRLGEYGETLGVSVLLETHGDFSSSDRILAVLNRTSSPAIGVIWDLHHTIERASEPLELTWSKLGRYIRHAHIKDAVIKNGKERLTLVGEGDLPIKEWISLLKKVNYDGWLSFEWEKRWYPEIEDPEIALPAFVSYIRTLV